MELNRAFAVIAIWATVGYSAPYLHSLTVVMALIALLATATLSF